MFSNDSAAMRPPGRSGGASSRRGAILVLLALVAAMTAVLVPSAVADHPTDTNKHCPDHQHEVKVDNPAAGSTTKVVVDGTDVWVHVSNDKKTVSFWADEAMTMPLTVEFCIKAAETNSGKRTGHSGNTGDFGMTNGGGQTPQISYVVVYGIAGCDVDAGDAKFLDLEDETDTNPVGTQHTVTATVTDENGDPCEGVGVHFDVTGVNSTTGTGTTDANGQVDFTYTGTNPGTDTITACFDPNAPTTAPTSCPTTDPVDANDNIDESDAVTKTWEADTCDVDEGEAKFLDLELENDSNPVGTQHTVTATVTDENGNPCEGVAVHFDVTGVNSTTGTGTTGANGQVDFTYTGNNAGTDTITACFDPNAPTTAPTSCPTTDPVDANDNIDESDAVTKTWTDDPPPAGNFSCRASLLRIEDSVLSGPVLADPFEPVVANEQQNPCAADDDGLLKEEVLFGGPSEATLLAAITKHPAVTSAHAEGGVLHVFLSDGTNSLEVRVLYAEATAECVDGNPVLGGSSHVILVAGNGTPIVNANSHQELPLGALGTVHVNETIDDGDTVTQRAFWLQGNPILGDVIIGEAIVDVHGNPCA